MFTEATHGTNFICCNVFFVLIKSFFFKCLQRQNTKDQIYNKEAYGLLKPYISKRSRLLKAYIVAKYQI